MYFSKYTLGVVGALSLVLGGVGGYLAGGLSGNVADAQVVCTVDQALLEKMYKSIFHRPLDAGATFHLGKDVNTVLNDFANSAEHVQYTGMFESMKAYEEARRAPGDLSQADKDKYLDLMDSAMSTVASWADTLPQQDLNQATIGPDHARLAIQKAYEMMNATAQQAAQYGLFQALERIGVPENIPSPDTAPVHTVPLVSQGGYVVSGNFTMDQVDGKMRAKLILSGSGLGANHPAHIHAGTCASPGAILHNLSNVVNGTSDTTLTVGGSELFAQMPWVVNVHKSDTEMGVYVACLEMTPTTLAK